MSSIKQIKLTWLNARFLPMALLSVLFATSALTAQPTLVQIKTSGDYLWGEGNALQVSEARELARMDLVNRIVVTIVAEQQLVEQEIDDNYTSEFRSESRSLSRMELRNLGYHEDQRRDRSWRVTAYVARDEFEASLAADQERIMAKVSQALATEQQSGLNQAIPLYTEVYLSTYFHPMPLYTNPDEFGSRALLRSYIQQKITDWMRSVRLDLIAIDNRSDAERTELYLNVRVRDATGPVDFITLAINRPGYATHSVMEGRGRIYLDRPFDARIGQLNLEMALMPGMVHDPGLNSLFSSVAPSVMRTLEVDVSDVLILDFEARSVNQQQVVLHPMIRNLAVFDVSWSAGNLGNFNESNPRINLSSLRVPELITLRLNQSQELTVQKILHPDGRLVDVAARVTEDVMQPTDHRAVASNTSQRPPATGESGQSVASNTTQRPPATGESGQSVASNTTQRPPATGQSGQSVASNTTQRPPSSGENQSAAQPQRPAKTSETAQTEQGIQHEEDLSASARSGAASDTSTSSDGADGSTSTSASDAMAATDASHRGHLQALIHIRDAQALNDRLSVLASRNVLTYGNRSAVTNPNRSYVVIVDPASLDVLHFLTPSQENQRTDLRTGAQYQNDLGQVFEGLGSIWIRFR
jgi:hypothetical protein